MFKKIHICDICWYDIY